MKKECFETEQGRFYVEERQEKLCIVSYQGNISRLTIPAEMSGKIVKSIGKKAFLSCKGLRWVSIPDCVEALEDWSFANCNFLEEVELPAGDIALGTGVFQGCKELKRILIHNSYICSELQRKQTGALLASTVNLLETPHLFSVKEAGSKEWLSQWDSKLIQFLKEDDKKGYTVIVLCGEEDYGSDENSLSYFLRQKRKSKVRLCFLRLLNPVGMSEEIRKVLEEYLKSHTKGSSSEETWQVVLQEHGNEKCYYEILTGCGCVTEENFQGFLEDLEENYPEMKAFLMKYKQEKLGCNDFFASLTFDL